MTSRGVELLYDALYELEARRHGRTAYMANPEFHMQMESATGEPFCYCRRIVEARAVDGRDFTIATYSPDGMADHEFERLVHNGALD